MIESYDSTEGYKIFKIPIENINNMSQMNHEQKDEMTAKNCNVNANQYPDNSMFYHNYMPYFPYQYDYMGDHRVYSKFTNPQTVSI